jgi:Na+:H+ antiporter, NhaA family
MTDQDSAGGSGMAEKNRLPKLVLPVEARDNCLGPPSARYSLVEYGDYESPHCRNVLGAVNELVRELQDDLCFVFRNFPQPKIHPRSRPAAEAAEAAGLQGKFWLMHDRIFAHQDDLSDKVLREIAQGLPIEMEDFDRDLSSGEAARRVDEDLESGNEAGVGDTPTFFVNGTLHTGQYEFLPLLDAVKRSGPKRHGSGAA